MIEYLLDCDIYVIFRNPVNYWLEFVIVSMYLDIQLIRNRSHIKNTLIT